MMYYLALLASFVAFARAETCTKPEVSATSFTTQDTTVLTNVAFIIEFTLKCGNGAKGISLHAEVAGKSLPAVRVSGDNVFQVSWVEGLKASSGDYNVALYDDEGFAALKKASRSGQETSSIKPLVEIVINFPGAYQGPWVNSEFLAAFLSILVCYLAFSAKSKLLS